MTLLCDQSDALIILELARRFGLSWGEVKASLELAQRVKRLAPVVSDDTPIGDLTEDQIAGHPVFSTTRSP